MNWIRSRNSSLSFLLLSGLLIASHSSTFAEEITPPTESLEAPATTARPAKIYTLADCIATALQQNSDILKARENIRRVDGFLVEVRAQALPSVTLNSGFNAEDKEFNSIGTGVLPASLTGRGDDTAQTWWSSGVRVSQLIYNGGATSSAIDSGKLQQRLSFQQLRATIDRVIYDTRHAFYSVLLDRAMVRLREESVTLLKEELETQRKRQSVGAATTLHVLRAEVELANAQPPLIRARNHLRLSESELTRLLSLNFDDVDPDASPIEISGELLEKPVPVSLAQALDLALAHRPSLQAAQTDVEVQKKNLSVTRAGYQPTLSVFTGYEFRSDRFLNQLGRVDNGWTTGVQGSWSLFDGALTKGRVDQATAQVNTAILEADATRRLVKIEVRDAIFSYQEALALISSQNQTVDQAHETLRQARARMEVGSATQLDVLNARVALTEAETNECQARFDYSIALARLEFVTGQPLDQPVAVVPIP